MEITFRCTSCRVKLGVEVEYAGKRMYCPMCGEKITIPKAGLGTWTTLGGCRLNKIVGEGSSGSVYLATERSMEREVAIKVFKPELSQNSTFLEKFKREIKNIARLAHPNIVRAYRAGSENEYHFLIMEYISAGTIEDRIIRHGYFTEKEALTITLLTSQALDYAWQKEGLLHLDLKPENLMLDHNGNVKITDLGIARCVHEFQYETETEITGTPAFMSPEQAGGFMDLDFRSDIFSLGATLYYMLTAKNPFDGESILEIMEKVINQEILPPENFNSSISKETSLLLKSMMKKDRYERPQDWHDIIITLKEQLASSDTKQINMNKFPTEPRIHINTKSPKARDGL